MLAEGKGETETETTFAKTSAMFWAHFEIENNGSDVNCGQNILKGEKHLKLRAYEFSSACYSFQAFFVMSGQNQSQKALLLPNMIDS